ncbi:MAG: TonB-dependent receptor [Methylococcales bacterium]|nr:TonB-dependent receptor [Methylococcales bacterium]
MRKILFGFLLLASAGVSFNSLADTDDQTDSLDDIVVTATRTATPEKEIGSAMTVITAADIAARQLNNVADVLRTVPGVDVLRSGGPGQVTSVFMRGANSNHTLVLIDGVEMNDPSSPNAAFDFANLQTDNIERIEVLRGAASAVYGSDAIGGVINVITKKGRGKPKYLLTTQGGSYGTWKTGGSVSGSTDALNYSLDASRMETTGFPAADRNMGNTTADPYRNTTVSGRTGLKVSNNLDFGATLRYNDGKTFIDDCGGAGCNDPNNYYSFNQLFTRGFGHLKLFDNLWEQTLGLAYSRSARNNTDVYNAAYPNSASTTAAYLGEKLKLDYQSIINLHKSNTVSLGVEEEADSIHSADNSFYPNYNYTYRDNIPSKTMNTVGYYLQDQIRLFDRSFTTAGLRFDDNNRFGGHLTWRINELYAIKETGTRLKGSYGTGFKAPALYQLYDPLYGNANLKPETSVNWDTGLEQDLWGEKITAGLSYFNNTFNNLIQSLAPTYVSENVDHAIARGVETYAELHATNDLSFRASYTHQNTRDLATGAQLLRRPNDKAGFDVDYRFLEKAHMHVNVLVVGQKLDYAQTGAYTTVMGYTLLNWSASYDIHPNLQLFGRIDNLLNKQYEEVYGYGTSGVAGYGGVKVSY